MTKKHTHGRLAAFVFVVGYALAAMFAAPSAFAADKPAIGVAVADQKSLFYIAAVNGMQAAAKKAGYKLKVSSASNNSSRQIKQIQNLLVQQIGALIFIPQDSTAAAAGVRAANRVDVPVVAVDERPESGGGKLATYIATNSVRASRQLCTWMFKQMGGKGKLAIIKGVLGSTAERQRTKGCHQALKKNPNIHVVAVQAAGWDQTKAYKSAQNILTANPELDAIFGESDAMAMGAAKAAKQAGRKGLIFAGIDGFPTMFQAIKSGLTQATKAQRPYKMGQMAVRNAIRFMQDKGQNIPPVQYLKATLITKHNIGQHDPTHFYGPQAKSMY